MALGSALILAGLAGQSHAQGEPEPPPASSDGTGDINLGASGFVGIPVGDFGDFVDFGLGALLTLDYGLNPQLELTGRAGFIYFLTDGEGDVTFYDIPFWVGGRYALDPSGEGIYLHGEVGINSYHVEIDTGFGTASDSNNELAVNLLAGTKAGKLVFEGGLYIGSIDESSDSMMIGATGGTTF